MAAMCADLATPAGAASAAASASAAVATAVAVSSGPVGGAVHSGTTQTTTSVAPIVSPCVASAVALTASRSPKGPVRDLHLELDSRRRSLLSRRRGQLKRKRVQLIETASNLFHLHRDEPLGYHNFSKRPSLELVHFLRAESVSSPVVAHVSKELSVDQMARLEEVDSISPVVAAPLTPPPSTDAPEEVRVEVSDATNLAQHVPSSPLSSTSPRLPTGHIAKKSTFTHAVSHLPPVCTGPRLVPLLSKSRRTEWAETATPLLDLSAHVPEGYVLKRTMELSREGLLWSKRLPKVCERPRQETHWDSTLKEMHWLAVDFYQERQWKKAAAKMLAYSAKEFVRTWEVRKTKVRENQVRQKRKRAGFLASKVDDFWTEAWVEQSVNQLYSSSEFGPGLSSITRLPPTICRDSGVEEDGDGGDSSCDEESNLLENGHFSEDEADDSNFNDCFCDIDVLDDESTISEQERFERESGTAIGLVEELKELALDLSRPVKEILSYVSDDTEEKVAFDETTHTIARCVSDLSLDSLESLIDEDVEEAIVRVTLSKRQRKLYDDFLAAAPLNDSSSSCIADFAKLASNLEQVCNNPSAVGGEKDGFLYWDNLSVLTFSSVVTDFEVHPAFTTMLGYDPFRNVDLNALNLVFLTHESRLTVISSDCIRAFCAPQKLIMSLTDQNIKACSQTPRAPVGRFVLEIQSTFLSGPVVNVTSCGAMSTTVKQRPAVSLTSHSVACSELDAKSTSKEGTSTLSSATSTQHAFHHESLEVISRFNERRCKGMPLYGQDLLGTLTVVDSVRPRFCSLLGIGYVNCLNASSNSTSQENRGGYMLKTRALEKLVHCSQDSYSNFSPIAPFLRKRVEVVTRQNRILECCENKLMPTMGTLAAKYSIPISSNCSEWTPPWWVDCAESSTKLRELVNFILKIRTKRSEKAVLVCYDKDVLDSVLRFLRKRRLDLVHVDTSLSLGLQFKQVCRFVSSRQSGLCLVTLASGWNSSSIRLLTGVKHLLLIDGLLHEESFQRWCRISRPLQVHRFVYEGTIEEAIYYCRREDQCTQSKEPSVEDALLKNLRPLWKDNGFSVPESVLIKPKNDLHSREELQAVPWPHRNGSMPLLSSQALETLNDNGFDDEIFHVPRHLKRYRETKLNCHDVSLDEKLEPSLIDDEWEASFFQKEMDLESELFFFESQCQLSYMSTEASKSWYDSEGNVLSLLAPPSASTAGVNESDVLQLENHLGLLYKSAVMSEVELPSVHVSKNDLMHIRLSSKRSAGEAGLKERSLSPKNKVKREDTSLSNVPPSLFNRNVSTNLGKMRRTEKLSQSNRSINTSRPYQLSMNNVGSSGFQIGSNNPPASLAGLLHPLPRPQVEQENVVEWLIQEDWALLHSVRECQELPLSLHVVSPAHTVNWDLVSDMVNSVSRAFRSARQCRHRYENIIVPREEGRILLSVNQVPNLDSLVSSVSFSNDRSSPKQRKLPKSLAKGPSLNNSFNAFQNKSNNSNRSNRTAQLVNKDKNTSLINLFVNRFETIKGVANKRTPTTKPILVNPTQNSASKHRDFLNDCGIEYEEPLGPIVVARNRAERIQKEKQKTLLQQHQVIHHPSSQAVATTVAQLHAASRIGGSAGAAAAGIAQSQHQSVVVGIRQPPSTSTAGATSLPASSSGASHPTTQQVIVQGTGPGGLTRLQVQPHPHSGQIVLPSSPAGSVQDIAARTVAAARAAAAAGNNANSSVVLANPQSSVANVVSIGNLTPSQFQVAQKLVNQSSPGTRGIIASKTLTPAQINQLKQQALLRKQQEQQQNQSSQAASHQQQQQPQTQSANSTSNSIVSNSMVQKANARQAGQPVQAQATQQTQLGGQQRLSLAMPAGGSIPAAVVSAGAVPGTVTVVSQAGQGPHKTTTHVIRQFSSGGAGKSFRNLTDNEIKMILAKQQQQQLGATAVSSSTGKLTSIQVPAGQQGNLQQILSQAGIQLHSTVVTGSSGGAGGQQLATLVKTVPSGHQIGNSAGAQSVTIPIQGLPANVKATLQRGSSAQQQVTAAASPQQMQIIQRHLMQQRAAAASGKVVATSSVSGSTPQKVAFGTTTGKMPTQLIVSAGNLASASSVSTSKVASGASTASVTVEQFQQLVKSAGSGGQQQQQFGSVPHALLTKQNSGGGGQQQQQQGCHQQTVQARVIPLNNTSHQGGSRTQQIQVVAAAPNSNPAVVAAALASRQFGGNAPQVTNVTNAGSVKTSSTITQQQLLSQLAYGQPISVAVRNTKPDAGSQNSDSGVSSSTGAAAGASATTLNVNSNSPSTTPVVTSTSTASVSSTPK